MTETTLIHLTTAQFSKKMTGDLKAAELLLTYIAKVNRESTDRINVLSSKEARKRLIALLPYLAQKAGRKIKNRIYKIELDITHQDMADLTGLTRESVTIQIQNLKKSGVIQYRSRRFQVNLKPSLFPAESLA